MPITINSAGYIGPSSSSSSEFPLGQVFLDGEEDEVVALASALMMMITLRNRLELNRVRKGRKIGLYRESLSYKWGKETLYGRKRRSRDLPNCSEQNCAAQHSKKGFSRIKKVEEGEAPYISRERREREDKSFPPGKKRRKKNLKCKSPSSLSFLSICAGEKAILFFFFLMFS